MLKKVRDTASETFERTKDFVEDTADRTKPLSGSAAKKAKGAATSIGRVAKTAGNATAGGAKTAAAKTASGVKTASAAAGKQARRAGGAVKNAAQISAAGAATVGSGAVEITSELGAKAWDKVDDKVEACWTTVKETFVETAGSAIQSAVKNDATMEKIFKVAYCALPSDMRRWVSEEQFCGFCFKNRNRLVKAALEAPTQSDLPALPEHKIRVVDV
jgi:hypothetical protein